MLDSLGLIVAAIAASSAAILATTILVKVRSEFTMPILPLKLAATALSPFVALLGLIGTVLGILQSNVVAVMLGVYGAVVAGMYIRAVTRPTGAFARVFGDNWERRIAPDLGHRMLPRRFMLVMPSHNDVIVRQDVALFTHLETGDPILADIWEPPANVPRTGLGVVYLHGSGWHYLKKDFFTRSFFRQLASNGHVIIDVAYMMAPKATIHGMVADAYRAVAWMKQNAQSLKINPDRVVLAGGSAGAQLALLAAYAPDHPDLKPADVTTDIHVCGVISYYGLSDVRLAQEHLLTRYGRVGHKRNIVDRVLMSSGGVVGRRIGFMPTGSTLSGPGYLLPAAIGGTPETIEDLYRLLSPLTYVTEKCPPTLLFHGSHDFALDVIQSRQLNIALQKANVPVVYVEFPYTEHVFDLFFSPFGPAFQAATYDAQRFLALLT